MYYGSLGGLVIEPLITSSSHRGRTEQTASARAAITLVLPGADPIPSTASSRAVASVGNASAASTHFFVAAQVAHQDVPAGRDRRLGELELADVTLGQHDGLGRVGVGSLPVQDEDALAAEYARSVARIGQR